MALDITRICRICLAADKQTYDIYTTFYVKTNTIYCDMLSYCTKIKPSMEDGLPRLICKECCRKLKRSYAFNLQCEESETRLKSLIIKSTDKNVNANGCKGPVIKNELDYDCVNGEIVFEISKETMPVDNADVKGKIKLEPMDDDGNESNWDAEDDNINLEEIKFKKLETEMVELKTKKKRVGRETDRKKKVFVEGEIAPVVESKLPHQCDVCGKFLSTKSNLKAHKLCHTDLRPYICTECPATFRGHSALFQHKKLHTGEKPYPCEYCPKKFRRRTGLVNHIRMHKGEKLYGCDVCFKTFVQSSQLSIHMKRHKGEKTFLCQVCGKGFPIRAELKVHQRTHNGEKPYSCHLCTKTFATSGNLSIHVRIHNKEIRYNCKECQRGFVTCSAYNVHLKRHKGQRDHHCECGKTFYTSSALKQHRVVHTGEKKYQCKVCDRKFTQTSHLSRHFKRDHVKLNAPVPPSEHYKVIVPQNKEVFNLIDGTQKDTGTPNVNADVKCVAPQG